MPTYWDSFIRNYEKEIINVSIRTMLEAYWYWCNLYKDKKYKQECDKLMGVI